jgi:hypothetical protein
MNISNNWNDFLKNFGKKFQKELIEIAQSNLNTKPNKIITANQYMLFEEPKLVNEEPQKELFNNDLSDNVVNAPFGKLLGAVARSGKPDK